MKKIIIDLNLRQLEFHAKGIPVKLYPIAIGKPTTPTPEGLWEVTRKIMHPGGILGSRWMELSIPSYDGPYGIHGTTHPWSIGKAISNGCIRMHNSHVEEIYPLTPLGTKVEIMKGNNFEEGWANHSKNNQVYMIKYGDTLWKIAKAHGVSLEDLAALNNIKNPGSINPGTIIKIP
ncbi:MAG: LysM peptidoglycan-binding domain-containing protein [Clostridia bacterium]|nr:LysM peptidoglycan-binding domain-containing protein [Clostridia bacterium]